MKKAFQRLARGPDGKTTIQYIDLETLQPITDLSGYQIVNATTGFLEQQIAEEESTTPSEADTGATQEQQPERNSPGLTPSVQIGNPSGGLANHNFTNTTLNSQQPTYAAPTGQVERAPLGGPVNNFGPSSTGGGGSLETGSLSFYNPGQEGIQSGLRDALLGTSAELGRSLGITSGHRDAAYNARVGGAPNSFHTHGQAADIDMSGLNEAQRRDLVQELTQRGAGGFITYSKTPDMMHVDMRARPDGTPHFMHDRSSRNMANAPGWFQDMKAAGGIQLPETAPIPTPAPRYSDALLTSYAPTERSRTPAQQAIDDVITGSTTDRSYTGAQAAALGQGFTGLTDQDIADIATVVAGELSPGARASIASGNPSKEALSAMGGILSTMSNRAVAKDTSVRDVAYEPLQYSAVNPSYIDATREMYEPVADQMNKAVGGFFSGELANNYGLDTVVPNPTATNYYADYVNPNWAGQLEGVTKDTTGHIFGYLPEFGDITMTGRPKQSVPTPPPAQTSFAGPQPQQGTNFSSRYSLDYFPEAPKGPSGGFASGSTSLFGNNGVFTGGNNTGFASGGSNSSDYGNSISPGAQSAIDSGQAGLF